VAEAVRFQQREVQQGALLLSMARRDLFEFAVDRPRDGGLDL
jgi:hypothetical protein